MGRNVGRLGNDLGCVPDRIYRGVSDWEDGVMVKTLPLTRGVVALVDDDVHKELSAFFWQARPSPRKTTSTFYGQTIADTPDGKKTTVRLHQAIMGRKEGYVIDHINGDGLDNRRENLRFATISQNCANKYSNPSSGFRGVYEIKRRKNPWRASIYKDMKIIDLGTYPTREDAARAYDKAAKELHGDFARLNFGDEK